MQAELIIRQASGVRRFSLEKGSYGISGLAQRAIVLGLVGAPGPAPDLLIDWDPALRTLTWREAGAPRSRGQALRPGEAFALEDLTFAFSLKWDSPVLGNTPCEGFALGSAHAYLFGRGPGDAADPATMHVALDAQDRTISKLHARLELENGDWMLSDHSSTETLLNGEPFTRAKLIFGDRFKIGDYVFEFRGAQIERVDHSDSGRIEAEHLAVVVKDRQTGNPLRILNDVGLRIGTGDFIGILGGSGSGKSTLLNALCGIRPADQGKVTIGGIENSLLNKLRPGAIGYVPQDDIVHPELVVRDAFYLAARLRLRLENKQRKALVERTIELLGLTEHADKRVYHLSGGQRKRVSIGIELLSKPSVMFLDEPSSGLDPATEESLMELLQSLTLTNLTVVCTTHVLQKAYLFDRLVFVHGGRVIFEGNSAQARDFFVKRAADLSESHTGSRSSLGITKSPLEKIYSEVLRGTKSAAQWEAEFKAWPGHQAPGITGIGEDAPGLPQGRVKRVSAAARFVTLLVRQWKILGADWLNLAFLFCQVILISLLIALVSDEFGFRMFLGLIATMWFGCSNGAQQIIGELPIVKREQICGLGRNVYLSSKFAFQGFISCVQGMLLLLIIIPLGHAIHPINFDAKNFSELYVMRLIQEGRYPKPPSLDDGGAADAFVAVGDDDAKAPATKAQVPKPPGVVKCFCAAPPVWLAVTAAKWLVMEDSFIESGARPINNAEGMPVLGADGQALTYPAIAPWRVLFIGVLLKVLAFFGAALVGVSLGLAVSAWVRSPTQAVMWVPLLLIPQILFGGYVVTLPKMSPLVRAISVAFPSHACQRVIDVSNLYGRATPYVTNLTKQPVFLTGAAEPEDITWSAHGSKLSESFDRESYVNTSWQNLAVRAERLGQHKKVWEVAGTDASGSEIKRKRDTVESRGDVRYSKGTPFLFTFPAVVAAWILIAWIGLCYGFALFGIHRKTHG
ncbi:MAG: ATP-binding cassette domain-containing protein [Verrucomicrobiota bacterium]